MTATATLSPPRIGRAAAHVRAAIVLAGVSLLAGPAWAGCLDVGLPASCSVAAGIAATPTASTLGLGNVYTFTVDTPSATWNVNGSTFNQPSTANGGFQSFPGFNPLNNAGSPLVPPAAPPSAADGSGFVVMQTTASGLTANTGALVAQIGTSFQPIAAKGVVLSGVSGALSFMMWGGKAASTGSLSVTVTQSADPTLLAGVNVSASANALTSPGPLGVSTGVILDPSKSYFVHPTNPDQLWSIGTDTNRTSTAAGVDSAAPVFIGWDTKGTPSAADDTPVYGPEGLCNGQFAACALPGGTAYGDPIDPNNLAQGFRFGELVALVNGKFYAIGNGRILTGLTGELFLLDWDSDPSDNFGFINVAVNLLRAPEQVPEPASLALLGLGLAGLGLARRRRVAA